MTASEATAHALGLVIHRFEVHDPHEIERAFALMPRKQVDAVIVGGQSFTRRHRQRIMDLALAARLPTMSVFRENVKAGGLMSYGVSLPDLFRRAGLYVLGTAVGSTVDFMENAKKGGEIPDLSLPSRILLGPCEFTQSG